MSNKVPIKTARRLFTVLETLEELNGATFSEVMKVTGMSKSSTHEYIQSLLEMNYVCEMDNTYYLSTRFLEMGEKRRQNMGIYHLAKPEINKLAKQTGERVSLMIEENGQGVHIYHKSDNNDILPELLPGQRFPLPKTSAGKAILSHLPENRVDEIITNSEKSIEKDRDTFYGELEEIAERGYAINIGGVFEGVGSVSTPIVCKGTVYGAITIGGPIQRLSEERLTEELPPKILASANIIEINLES